MLHRSYDENNGLNTSHRKIFWPKAPPPPPPRQIWKTGKKKQFLVFRILKKGRNEQNRKMVCVCVGEEGG